MEIMKFINIIRREVTTIQLQEGRRVFSAIVIFQENYLYKSAAIKIPYNIG